MSLSWWWQPLQVETKLLYSLVYQTPPPGALDVLHYQHVGTLPGGGVRWYKRLPSLL
jgi:hypothetical protein